MIAASAGGRLLELYRRYRVSMANMDLWWSGYAATIPGMAGSWLSFVYFGAGIWALFSVALRRYPIDVPRRARPFVYACLAYFGAMLLSGLVNGNLAELPRGIATATSFLVVPLLISRLRFSVPEGSWRVFCTYAPLGVLAGAAVGIHQYLFSSEISGGAGNPNVYAVVMADLGVLSLAGVFLHRGRMQAVCIAAFMLAALMILASAARTIWPIIVLAPLLLFWFARRHLPRGRARAIIVGLVVVVGLVGVLGSDRISGGISNAKRDLELASLDRFDTSLGMRFELWRAGVEAARQQPLLGYGPQNKMDAASAHFDEQLSYLPFTHLHNAALDTMVAAGLPGLLALVALFLTPFVFFSGRDENTADRRFALAAHVLIYALSGLTGALFTHDLLTVCFLVPIALMAATAGGDKVGGSRVAEPTRREPIARPVPGASAS